MTKRYRTIVKVFCPTCKELAQNKKKFDTSCTNCRFLRYNNVPDLVSFTAFLDKSWSDWVYMNVYGYVKGDNGPQLGSYTNFGTRRVPTLKNEL
jgi:hypothetical protein